MSNSLRNFVFIVLFLAPSSLFGMDFEIEAPQLAVKRQSEAGQEVKLLLEVEDGEKSTIVLDTANQPPATIKNMTADIKEEAELPIPLPKISVVLLSAIQKLAELPTAELKTSEKEKLARELQQIVAYLKSNGQPLDNLQLIEFITGANFLDIPLVEPAFKALARRILNKDEWLKLESLGDKLKNLWSLHPAKKLMLEGLSLQHPWVEVVIECLAGERLISWSLVNSNIKIWDTNNLAAEPITHYPEVDEVIECLDGKTLISWPKKTGTIKIWDINNPAEPITYQHPKVNGVIESMGGKKLISWSMEEGAIKIGDKNNLAAEPITLQHPKVDGVKESRDGKKLISWSWHGGTIKIWDMALFDPSLEQILLQLAVYFVSEGNQVFDLAPEKHSELKTTFNSLSPTTQASLEKQAPQFIAAIKSV